MVVQDNATTKVTVFLDSGANFNAISPDVVQRLDIKIQKHEKPLLLRTGADTQVEIDRNVSNIVLKLNGFEEYRTPCYVMPIPEGKDVMLGMPWFKNQNPIINWKRGLVTPLKNDATEDFIKSYYQKIEGVLREKDTEYGFFVQAQEKTKKDRYTEQNWDKLKDNPAYEILVKYKNSVFKENLPNKKPTLDTKRARIQHEIFLKDEKPVFQKQFRLSRDKQEALEKWVRDMIEAGVIQESVSPFSAPTFCVKKPVGWRVVHDYRQLNSKTIIPQIPTPRKEDIIERMAGCQVFSTCDLTSGYFQMLLKKEHRQYTAFSVGNKHYEYCVVPMGLSGAPGSFNRLIQKIFTGYEEFAAAYFDDIFIYTKDMKSHLDRLDEILKVCEKEELYLKLSKCVIAQDEIPCLGDFVGVKGIRMDPEKINIIRDWQIPKTKQQMKKFLGTIVYNDKFCKDFGTLVAPLHEATRGKTKHEPIELNDLQRASFDEIKKRMTTTPVLAVPDTTKDFMIQTDASNFAVGGVLLQGKRDSFENYKIVAYYGKKMSDQELKYPVREQELLAILQALRKWRPYLLDRPFIVQTDHKSLSLLLSEKRANRRLVRWLDELSEYPMEIQYLPGDENNIADGLSRCANLEPSQPTSSVPFREFLRQLLGELDEQETKEEILLSYYQNLESSISLLTAIQLAYAVDESLVRLGAKIRAASSSEKGSDSEIQYSELKKKYSIKDNLIYKKINDKEELLIIPDDKDLQDRIIYSEHDDVVKGHPGEFRTLKNIQRKYFWKNMHKSIHNYVKECQICQRTKARHAKSPGLLRQHMIPSGRWTEVTMDFITNLPTTIVGNYSSIWTIVCRLTKRIKLLPVKDTTSTKELVLLWENQYINNHGIPEVIICDRDSRFTAQLWQDMMKFHNTKLKMSCGYRSETAGQAERIHRSIEDYFRCYLTHSHRVWNEYLGLAEFSYNSTYHSTIDMSPFEADIGFIPPMDVMGILESKNVIPIDNFLTFQQERLKWAKEKMSDAQARAQKIYNQHRPLQEFKIKDKVLVSTKNMAVRHLGTQKVSKRKFTARWIGPFEVIKRISYDSYELNMGNIQLHNVYHTSSLKPYYSKTNTIDQPVQVVLSNGEEGYIVEKILNERRRRGVQQYQVKWLGTSEITWEPLENLLQVQGLIEEYNKSKKMNQRLVSREGELQNNLSVDVEEEEE